MEVIPTLTDYVTLIIQLFRQFEQDRQAKGKGKQGAPFTYAEEMFIIFFLLMQFRRIYQFKAQHRWLTRHPELLERLGWAQIPGALVSWKRQEVKPVGALKRNSLALR